MRAHPAVTSQARLDGPHAPNHAHCRDAGKRGRPQIEELELLGARKGKRGDGVEESGDGVGGLLRGGCGLQAAEDLEDDGAVVLQRPRAASEGGGAVKGLAEQMVHFGIAELRCACIDAVGCMAKVSCAR